MQLLVGQGGARRSGKARQGSHLRGYAASRQLSDDIGHSAVVAVRAAEVLMASGDVLSHCGRRGQKERRVPQLRACAGLSAELVHQRAVRLAEDVDGMGCLVHNDLGQRRPRMRADGDEAGWLLVAYIAGDPAQLNTVRHQRDIDAQIGSGRESESENRSHRLDRARQRSEVQPQYRGLGLGPAAGRRFW